MFLKKMIIVSVLVFFLTGCSIKWWTGDGRGDWTQEIYNGYAITKINSREVLLVYRENQYVSGGSIAISNYYIQAYQLHEPYIILKGICTQNIAASEEELNKRVLSFYWVDTTNGEVVGPFLSYDDLVNYGNSLVGDINSEWVCVEAS